MSSPDAPSPDQSPKHDRAAFTVDVFTLPEVVVIRAAGELDLAANAIDHAHGVQALRLHYGDPGSPIRLEIDDGRPDLHLNRPSAGSSRGRGLILVEAISCQWGVITHDDDRKTVWADIATT